MTADVGVNGSDIRQVLVLQVLHALGRLRAGPGPQVDLVDEELFANIDKLPVDNPGVQLVVEDLVTAEENPREHILDDWVTARALLVERVEDLTTSLALLLDLEHQIEQGWEHLEVDTKLLLEGEDGQGPVLQVLSLDRQDVFFVDRDHFIHARAEGLDVDAIEHHGAFLLIVVPFGVSAASSALLLIALAGKTCGLPVRQVVRKAAILAANSRVSI